MRIDIHADAPFDIKQDIDDFYYSYQHFLNKYGLFISISLILAVVVYAVMHWRRKEEPVDDNFSEINRERMRAIRRKQVGESLEDQVRRRKEGTAQDARS
ncbi:hypothetical protein WA556_000425 [Blastocystis sp. ATCC 50177/Nand II]